MQKVIGLDIGSFSIKAIEIVNTFKSYEVVNFYETVVPTLEGVPLDAVVPVCMEQLFKENNIQADRIITAMPGQFISSRILPFNFTDPRKIEASIMVELEDLIPFNMDDMVVDHQILGTMRNQTMVLAVMTRKAFLKNFLDLLDRIHIDPKLVDIDSLAFYNLSSHLNLSNEGSFAMVDVGHEKTSVCIIRDGVLRMFRSINLGGRYITEFLARDLECDYYEAQRIKHRVSMVLTQNFDGSELDADNREVAERITLATNAIVKELGRTFYSFKSYEKTPLAAVYLSGGTSRVKGFETLLSEQLELPVEKLRLDNTQLDFANNSLAMESVPQSLAIGLRAVTNIKKHSQINLRRGEFAYVQNYEVILKGASVAFKVVALALALLVVSYAVKFYFYQNQIDALRDSYISVYKSSFPKAKTKRKTFSAVRKEAHSRMAGGIGEIQGAISEYKIANSSSPALLTLKAISEKIPKDVLIDVTLFDFKTTFPGQGKLIFKAETDAFESVAKIVDALKEVSELKEVKEVSSSSKPGSEKKIEFSIHALYETI